MTPRPNAIRNLTAWNEGDTEALPEGYGPDALDFQLDLRAVLAMASEMVEASKRPVGRDGIEAWRKGKEKAP